jgi:hypothetical protein
VWIRSSTSIGALREGFGRRTLNLGLSWQKLLRHSLALWVPALLEAYLRHLLVIHGEIFRVIEILDS